MYTPTYTSDPKRIARLEVNVKEGLARESLAQVDRDRLDRQALSVDSDRLQFLFKNAAENRAAAIAARKAAF
jgi:hypothetical protein